MNPWARFVAWGEREVDARPMALVRILLCLAILGDQLRLAWTGLLPLVYRNGAQGGLAMPRGRWYLMDDLFGDPYSGEITWGLLVLSTLAALFGIRPRVAMLGMVWFSAQLGHGFHWDNGGDRIARWVLLFLVFSGAATTWTWRDRAARAMSGWTAHLLRFFLFLIYLDAGLAKLFPRPANWLSMETGSVTYRILTYPMTSDLWASTWHDWTWTLHLADLGTIVLEVFTVWAILTPWRKVWALCAVPIHLGIWWGMTIDHFAFVMLALYPVLFDEWIVAAIRGWQRMRGV